MTALLAVDAGGTSTRALLVTDRGEHRLPPMPSINPSAMGEAADRTLDELFAAVRHIVPAGEIVGWLASAAVDRHRLAEERRRLRAPGFRLVMSNDVVPLLWGVPALSGRGVVVVCGTGTGFFGGDGNGRTAIAGGCEYLASDEGSAVDIGMRGLRAAVRAHDGRGPATALVAALEEYGGTPIDVLARRLAAQPYPKQSLAALAPAVCRTRGADDAVAGRVVAEAVGELMTGVRAVRDRLGLGPGFAVAVTGGVVQGCAEFRDELRARLVTELGAGPVELVTDTPAVVLTALRGVLDDTGLPRLPAVLAAHAEC
jgi:N-acetylglucosamine kinase-like BadF-type ATPase